MIAGGGRTILLTRTEEDAGEWADFLRRRGDRPVVFPCLVCEPIEDPESRAALREALAGASWLVLTSRRGVEAAAHLLGASLPEEVRLAVVGPATAAAARAAFGRVDLVPGAATGEGVARALVTWFSGMPQAPRKIAAAAADRAAPALEEILTPAGIAVARVAVYRTIPAPPEHPRFPLGSLGLDAILLASPSAVTGLLHRAEVPEGVPIVTIGPSTSAAARAAGLTVAAEAPRPGLEGLLEVLP